MAMWKWMKRSCRSLIPLPFSDCATSGSSVSPTWCIPAPTIPVLNTLSGTMHLAGVACRQFGLSKEDRLLVLVAALLHDVGHGPFSHASEPLMEARLGRTHDDIAGIVDAQFGTLLEPLGIVPSDLCAVVKGRHPLSGIIHGDLDVDRMDYLLRDAYYTGAPYGTVDAHRLIRNLRLTHEGIVLDENGINAAESLLIARTLMRPTVYYHHVSRIGECMFQIAMLDHLATHPRGGIERTLYARRCGVHACAQKLKKFPFPRSGRAAL